jgi:lipid A 3-O-deacylase
VAGAGNLAAGRRLSELNDGEIWQFRRLRAIITGYWNRKNRTPDMSKMRILLLTLLLLSQPLFAGSADRTWVNAVSLTFGTSNDFDESDVSRVGFQKTWRHSWFDGGAWYLGGYWDTGLTRIKADTGHTGTVYDINLSPVFRYQRDAGLSSGLTPFAEAGFGVHLLTDTHIGNNNLSTAFQFGSLLGLGVGFGERGQYELTYQYTSMTNADLKKPNDGFDAHLLKLGYNFN